MSGGFELLSGAAVYRTAAYGEMRVEAGRLIEWAPADTADERSLALLTAGPGLAMALSQREYLVLHGACVADERGQALCLAGPSGAGKSSLAAALLASGWHLLSDGMTVIRFDAEGRAWAQLGPRQLKLWPDAAQRLGRDASELERVLPGFEKRLVALSAPALAEPVPLAAVLLVEPGADVELAPIRGAAALMGLVAVHFLSEYVGTPSAAKLLKDCARLGTRVVIARLRRGQLEAQIPEALDAVRRFAAQRAGSQRP